MVEKYTTSKFSDQLAHLKAMSSSSQFVNFPNTTYLTALNAKNLSSSVSKLTNTSRYKSVVKDQLKARSRQMVLETLPSLGDPKSNSTMSLKGVDWVVSLIQILHDLIGFS